VAINFPTTKEEAGLPGSGALEIGDQWRYNTILYVFNESPDGTSNWSSKGINVNPDLYIAKTDEFTGNIDKTYNQGLEVTYADTAGNATTADSATSADNATTADNADKLDGREGSFYRNASNLNTGKIPDGRLPDSITSNISGNAATATNASNADKLDGQEGADYHDAAQLTGQISDARLP